MKEIPGYIGYFIDTLGNVYSNRKRGKGFGNTYDIPRLLKQFTDRDGYKRVMIYRNRGDGQAFIVSRLMLFVFRPNDNYKKLLVRHMDGNPANNTLENLEWGTYIDNESDKKRHGRNIVGEKHHNSKLDDTKVLFIKKALKIGIRRDILGKMFSVNTMAIGSIAREETWKHIQLPAIWANA